MKKKNEKKTLVYCAFDIIAVFLMTFIFIKKQQTNSFEDYGKIITKKEKN